MFVVCWSSRQQAKTFVDYDPKFRKRLVWSVRSFVVMGVFSGVGVFLCGARGVSADDFEKQQHSTMHAFVYHGRPMPQETRRWRCCSASSTATTTTGGR